MSDTLDTILGINKQDDSTSQAPEALTPSQRYISSLDNFNLDQVKPILDNLGNALVVSAAGSGKTTALSIKMAYDFVNGRMNPVEGDTGALQPVWLGTFLRSGAHDLYRSLSLFSRPTGFNLASAVSVSTIHAEFYRVCKYLGYSGDMIPDYENKYIFKSILRKKMHVSEEKEEELFAQSEKFRGNLEYDETLTPITKEAKAVRNAKGKLDFTDLEEFLYTSAVIEGRPEVVNFLKNRYRRIYLDEFQDVSHIQYEILKVYASHLGIDVQDRVDERKKGCIIAIGDDDQSIYSWRGADPSFIVSKFKPDYNASVYHLDVNYRTPSTVLKAVLPSISKNVNRLPKDIQAAHEGGSLRLSVNRDYSSMLHKLIEVASEDIGKNRSIALLVRNNSDAIAPATALLSSGYLIRVSDGSMTYRNGYGVRVMGLYHLLMGSTSAEARKGLPLVSTKMKVRALTNSMKDGQSFWDLTPTQRGYLNDACGRYNSWRQMAANGMTPQGIATILNQVAGYYMGYAKGLRSASVLIGLSSLIQQYETMESLVSGIIDISNKLAASAKLDQTPQVVVSTVHEFKGKEADSVYVYDDTVHRIEKGFWEEERRVHYIACTRARKEETIFTLSGEYVNPFLTEMDLRSAVRL